MRTAPVAVIIPCYNASDTVERAVRSVWAQTLLPRELWLVDDASTDKGKTVQILRELQRRSCVQTEVITFDRNRGPSAARNAAWNATEMPYVAFLDSDDSWHPMKIERQYAFMVQRPEIVLSGHYLVAGPTTSVTPGSAVRIKPVHLLMSNRFSTPTVMIKNSIPFRFREDKRYSEDYLLWLEIVMAGYEAWLIQEPLARCYKPLFGHSGLSGDLWRMELGELESYWTLYRQGAYRFPIFAGLTVYSFAKFIRRVIVSTISSGTRNRVQLRG